MDSEPRTGDAEPKLRTPPYIAYKTFLTLLSELKTNGLPPKIDRSVLTRFAGGLQGQILLALRSLDLVDEKNQPRKKLGELVDAYETDRFKPLMRGLIEETYSYVFKLDLMAATPSMFADAFKNATDAKEEVLRKCRTFFLHAAKDLEIPLGPRIANAKFPRARASNGQQRTRAPKTNKGAKQKEPSGETPPDDGIGSENVLAQLLEKFPEFDPGWPDEIKKQWFDGFERFMSGAGVKKKGDT